MKFLFCLLFIFPISTHALFGVDVSTSVTASQWECIKNSSDTFGVVRALRSNGEVDTAAPATIKAGLVARVTIYAYAYPCYGSSCPNASTQMQTVINYLQQNNLAIGGMFLDIEGTTWSSNTADNVNFIQEMVDELHALKVIPLIYTNQYNWQQITDNNMEFSQYKLWYAHYDNDPSYDDFVTFGGWTRPNMKQYQQNQAVCGVNVDLNYSEILPKPAHAASLP